MTAATTARLPGIWRTSWRLGGQRPVLFALQWPLWSIFHALPVLPGLALKGTLDRVASGRSPWWWVAGLVAAEVLMAITLRTGVVVWSRWWRSIVVQGRANLLHALARTPGPGSARLPGPPGETVGRFRDDLDDFYWFLDIQLDTTGGILFTVVAGGLVAAVDPLVAVVGFVPVALTVATSQAAGARLRTARRRHREAAARLGDFVGETFGNVLAVKTAGAEERVIRRFRALADHRRRAARHDQVLEAAVLAAGSSTMALTIGLVLLVIAPAMRRGDVSVGDLALVASYAGSLGRVPNWVAGLLARRKQAGVNLGRLAVLLPGDDPTGMTARLPATDGDAARAPSLEVLEVRGLTALHTGTGRGVAGVDLVVRRGEVVAVTGPVGSGKSTLLAAVLGLVPRQEGSIRWNGAEIADPSTVLVPPRAAYVPQVPRLFSESIADNVLLGLDVPAERLERALRAAALEGDVAGFPDGVDTLVGSRGARLSGGQVLRTAAARALVREPDLLVVDDVSSALDGDTEERLWSAVLRPGATVLVVTHRPQVLARADRVVVLGDGRVVETSGQVTRSSFL